MLLSSPSPAQDIGEQQAQNPPAGGESVSAAQEEATSIPTQTGPLMDRVVCEVGDEQYTARDVAKAIGKYSEDLLTTLEKQEPYRKLYFSSPRFLFQVRAFADLKRLNALGIPDASQIQLEREAEKWAMDRSRPLSPKGVLSSQGLEIEVRARLIARQQSVFGTAELRQHMLRSVPEFFGILQCSWIRIPLFKASENRALSPVEIRENYEALDEVARELTAEKLSWAAAVKKYSKDPASMQKEGAIGLLRREMTGRFEESLLRPLFADLGYKRPHGHFLRGPIVGEKWIYLVRVEALQIKGVVELSRVREKVVRSLRESTLQEQIAGIRKVMPGKIFAPLHSNN